MSLHNRIDVEATQSLTIRALRGEIRRWELLPRMRARESDMEGSKEATVKVRELKEKLEEYERARIRRWE